MTEAETSNSANLIVIIPVNNDAQCLKHCLQSLANQSFQGVIKVIISANACTDNSVQVAQSWKAGLRSNIDVTILESDEAGKAKALNRADVTVANVQAKAITVYLDADIALSENALAEIINTFADDPKLRLCAPRIEPHRSSSFLVRSYVAIWSACPQVSNRVIGAGCYAVNADGRSRWGRFPDFGSDDTYVRLQFNCAEQQVVKDAAMAVYFPNSARELVRVRMRWSRNREFLRRHSNVGSRLDSRKSMVSSVLKTVVFKPRLWAAAPGFMAIMLATSARHILWRAKGRDVSFWSRSNSSPIRTGITPAK